MKTDTRITGIEGILIIHSIINKHWKSDWQKFDQETDDGFENFIIWEPKE